MTINRNILTLFILIMITSASITVIGCSKVEANTIENNQAQTLQIPQRLQTPPSLPIAGLPDCPRGEINCSYPGKCGSYTDSNSDQICDHSQ